MEKKAKEEEKAWKDKNEQEKEATRIKELANYIKSDEYKANLKAAEQMRDKTKLEKYLWMYDNFKTGDKYDIKHGKPEMEHAGNFNYGAMGRAAGLSEQELKRGAGFYQKYGNNGKTYDSSFGDPTDFGFMTAGTAYGEDPKDQAVIRFGINYYDNNYGKI